MDAGLVGVEFGAALAALIRQVDPARTAVIQMAGPDAVPTPRLTDNDRL